jgi:hypothetical protein
MPATPPRTAAVVLAALAVGVALAGAAHAVPRARCAGLQQRAQAKLERGLVACVEHHVSAAIARCGTTKWLEYTRRLRRGRCPLAEAALGRPGHPLVAKVRAEGISADDLAAADVRARAAHLALRAVLARLAAAAEAVRAGGRANASLARFAGEVTGAVDAVAAAEQRLSDVETALWGGMRADARLPWLVDEPLRAAMEQVQVELRRLLDPDFRTEIVALRDEPACAGDVIGDRLVAAYGRAVLAGGDDGRAAVAALGRLAAQLACLSFRQASLLDLALGVAWDMVATRLERAGLGRVRGPFVRYVAPVQALVLDTVKHAGERAHAWHWFREHEDVLRDEVDRLGWPTRDVVWLYDRLDARLVGFPSCADGDLSRCVDLPAFLASLADPRALGLGDCALAGMVARGLSHAGGTARYACPSAECTDGAPAGGGLGGVPPGLGAGVRPGARGKSAPPQGGGALPWSGLTAADRGLLRAFGCGGGGGGGGGSGGEEDATQGRGGHGGAAGAEDCVEQAVTAPRDPYGAWVRCAADAVGPRGPGATLDLAGVPTGPDCAPSVAGEQGGGSGGGGTTPTTTPPTATSSTTVAASGATSTTEPPSGSPPCVPSGLLDAIAKLLDCGPNVLKLALSADTPKAGTKGGPSPASAAGAIVNAEIELLKPENAQNAYDAMGANLKRQIEWECASGTRLSAAECATLDRMSPGDAAEYLRNKGLMDCVEGQECDAVCTGLDQQVMERLEDCQRTLDETLRGDAPTQHDLDSRIQPTPDAATGGLPPDPLTSCLLADAPADTGGMSAVCGLVLCTDGPAVASTTSACCGLGAPALGVSAQRMLLERTCGRVQCGEGESAAADGLGVCGCGGGVGGGAGGAAPLPGPSPERGR